MSDNKPEARRERKQAYNAAYREAHREELREYFRAHYEAHREERLAAQHVYYESHREEQRERDAAYRATHREEIRERVRKRQLWFKRWTALLKATQGCMDCGTHEGPLDYHHLDPSTKRCTIAEMANYSEEAFLDEVAKCTVLCPSCHKKRHAILKAAP